MSDTKTPLLGIDYLMPEQAQKHVTINDALRRFDGLVQLSVINRTETSPPASPENGDRYLIAANASDAWQRHAGKLALFEDSGWAFVEPQIGWSLWDAATKSLLVFDGDDWLNLTADKTDQTPSLFVSDEAEFDLANETGSLTIPSHITFLGVSARVLDKTSGPSNWQLGTNADSRRFGSGLSIVAGAEMRGPSSPPQVYWSSERVMVSSGGPAFEAGRVAVAIHYIKLPLPSLS